MRLERLLSLFGSAEANRRGSRDLPAIASAAAAGRVATLLIDADRVAPGRLVADEGRIEFGDLAHPAMDDVLDDLGELVLKMRGDVVVVPSDRMPTPTGAAAIFRF